MPTIDNFVSVLRDLVVDVDAMGGIRVDARSRVLGLAEEIDTQSWANLAIIVKSASDLLGESDHPEPLSQIEEQHPG